MIARDASEIPRPLWHFTCEHAAIRILNDATLRPQRGGLSLGIWLTDLPVPPRRALGLTSHTLRCDRMEYRFEVPDPVDVVPWLVLEPAMPAAIRELSETPGAMPAHWFLTAFPQHVGAWRRQRRSAFEQLRGAS